MLYSVFTLRFMKMYYNDSIGDTDFTSHNARKINLYDVQGGCRALNGHSELLQCMEVSLGECFIAIIARCMIEYSGIF
jgi:hypothetical protein